MPMPLLTPDVDAAPYRAYDADTPLRCVVATISLMFFAGESCFTPLRLLYDMFTRRRFSLIRCR